MERPDMGMAHLLGQANKKKVATESDPTKCWRVYVPLSGMEFFTEENQYGPTELGMKFMVAYSEIRDKDGKFVSVQKHSHLTLVVTGFIIEYVKQPSWWEKRDSGGL